MICSAIIGLAFGHHADTQTAQERQQGILVPNQPPARRARCRPGDVRRHVTTPTVARDTFGVFGTTAVLLVTEPGALSQARRAGRRRAGRRGPGRQPVPPGLRARRRSTRPTARRSPVSDLFADLIEAALRAARLTDGDVDPTCGQALAGLGYDRDFAQVRAGGPASLATVLGPVPGWRRVELDQELGLVRLPAGTQLDLGATAKAWAADHCAELIAGRLGCGVLVSLGGDLAVAGPVPEGGWRVRVTDDHAAGPEAPGQTVTIIDGGLATSSTTVRTWTAGGRQVHHIIDPATGEPGPSPAGAP